MGIAALSVRRYRSRSEQKRNTKLQPIDGRRHLHSLNPEQRCAVEYGIDGDAEPPPALLIAAGAGTGTAAARADGRSHSDLRRRSAQHRGTMLDAQPRFDLSHCVAALWRRSERVLSPSSQMQAEPVGAQDASPR